MGVKEYFRTRGDDGRDRRGATTMAIPNDLRQMNRRRIVLASMRLGSASRSQLARATGLSQPTAGKIADDLLDERVLADDLVATPVAEPLGMRMGRPGHSLRLNGRSPRYLAMQLGVTHTRMAALAVAPPAMDEWGATFATSASSKEWVAAVTKAAKAILPRKPEAVLVSMPGVIDEAEGRVLLSPNLGWAEGIDLPKLLGPALGAPVHVIQEIRCLAMGHRAIEPDAENFLMVDFGTGVGSAAMVGGSVYRGPLALSGELGHTPVPGNTLRCGCGATGCLETLVSRKALMHSFQEIDGRARQHRTWDWLVKRIATDGLSPKLATALDAAGAGIAGALNILGVDRVIVTGSLADLPPVAIERLTAAVRHGALWARFGQVHLSTAPRRRLAGLACMAIDRVIAPT